MSAVRRRRDEEEERENTISKRIHLSGARATPPVEVEDVGMGPHPLMTGRTGTVECGGGPQPHVMEPSCVVGVART